MADRSPKTNQLILFKKLYEVVQHVHVARDRVGTKPGELYDTLRGFDTSKPKAMQNGLYPYFEDPDVLVANLVNPPISKEFVHACPNILSVLEPHLRFYIRDNLGYEEEIYFSDHTSGKLLGHLARVRRSDGSLEEIFGPRTRAGSNVGIRSFSWEYANKHEGDRIIGANLELYFGSLVELMNKNYLKFLFTNGLRNPYAKSLAPEKGKAGGDTEARQIANLRKRIETATANLKSTTITSNETDFAAGLKNDFRQIRVVVGWSVPKGDQKELIKMFRGSAENRREKMLNFLEALKVQQRTILLNLVDYTVNFQQEGPTTLSIRYVGSTDNYISSDTSDIFGSHNNKDEFMKKVVAIPVDEINTDDVWKEGYLESVIKSSKTLKGPDGQTLAGVIPGKLLEEMDVLLDKLNLNRLIHKGEAPSGGAQTKTEAESIKAWMGPVDVAIAKTQEALQEERNAFFLESLLERNKIFQAEVKADSKNKFNASEILEFNSQTTKIDDIKKRIKDIANANKRLKAGDATENQDAVSKDESITDKRADKRYVYFMRLGDIISTAMRNAQLRDDVNLILGSFSPYELGLPGYNNNHQFEGLYNLPISIEYYTQFFYDNVVASGRSSYPFKRFIDDMMAMVGRLLNEVNEYRLRVTFDMSLYSTFYSIKDAMKRDHMIFLTEAAIRSPEFPKNLKNLSMSGADRKQLYNYYVLFAKQMNHAKRKGIKSADEAEGIFHYIIGAECGIAKKFNFKKMEQAHFKALNIESAHFSSNSTTQAAAAARALFLPQNITIDMVGNTIHKNGDLIYVDSRMVLGKAANEVLALGGYYRVVKSKHTISSKGYETQIDCVFEKRTSG